MNSINKVFEEIGTLRVTGATRVIFPWAPTKEEGIDVSSLTPRFEGCYASNNGTVAFVSQGEFFVAPYTRKLEALL